MISKQELKIVKHLADSMQEICSALENSLNKENRDKSVELNNDLAEINNEIKKRIKNVKSN